MRQTRMRSLIGAGAVLLLAGCGTASSDHGGGTATRDGVTQQQVDDAYISVLSKDGITANRAKLVDTGHAICKALQTGTTTTEMADGLIDSVGDVITAEQVGQLIGASTAAYCPQFNSDQIGS